MDRWESPAQITELGICNRLGAGVKWPGVCNWSPPILNCICICICLWGICHGPNSSSLHELQRYHNSRTSRTSRTSCRKRPDDARSLGYHRKQIQITRKLKHPRAIVILAPSRFCLAREAPGLLGPGGADVPAALEGACSRHPVPK